MSKNYLDVVANAFQEVRAWKYACLILGIVCFGLCYFLVSAAKNAPMVLIPYDFAVADGPQKIKPGGNDGMGSPDYLSQIALGDLATVLNWTPLSVEVQHQRFLNRMTPNLYAEQNVTLLAQAADFRNNSTTESFYPSGSKADAKGMQTVVDGTLVRWTGEKETLRLKVSYTITYAQYKGYLHVSGLQIKN